MMSDKATEDRQVVETNLKNGQDLTQATASFTVMNTLKMVSRNKNTITNI